MDKKKTTVILYSNITGKYFNVCWIQKPDKTGKLLKQN